MPYSSNDIAMQISQQNQMFMQGAQMSNQMGMAGSMGQPGFNQSSYDPTTMQGMTGANVGRMGTAATLGMLPSMPGMMGAVGGIAGGLMGKSWAKPLQMFDPISMGLGGFKAGGMMGGIAAGGLSMGIGAAASYGAEQMYKGAVGYQRAGTIMNQSYGGTFQPGEMQTTGGTGFGAGQKRQMASLIRQMEYIPELMTSSDELQRVLVKMEQTGMMSGAVGVTEIGRRFKDGIKTLRSLASVMGTTMEEALPLFQEARTSGFFSAQDVMRNAVNRQVVGGTIGFTQGQLSAVSAGGAQMVSQMGGSQRAAGAAGAQRALGQIGMARRMGLISEEQVAAATGGQTGTQGAVALQQQFQQAGMQLAQSGMGRLVTAAAAQSDEEGNFTGRLNRGVLKQIQGGGMGRGELQRMAQENLQGRRGQFAMMEEELTSSMAAEGPQSIVAMLRSAIDKRGAWGEDLERVTSHILKSYTSMAKPARDLLIKMTKEAGEVGNLLEQQQRQTIEGMKIKELYRTRSLGYRWEQFKTSMGAEIASPLQAVGEDISYGFEKMGEEFNQWLSGVDVVNVSALGAKNIRTQLSTGQGAMDLTGQGGGGLAGRQSMASRDAAEMVGGTFYGDSRAETMTASARAFGLLENMEAGQAGLVTRVGGAFSGSLGKRSGVSTAGMKAASDMLTSTVDMDTFTKSKNLSPGKKAMLSSTIKEIGRLVRVDGHKMKGMTPEEKLEYFEKKFGGQARGIGVTMGEVLALAEQEEGLESAPGWTGARNMLRDLASGGDSASLASAAERKEDAVSTVSLAFRTAGITGDRLGAIESFMQNESVGAGALLQAAGKGEITDLVRLANKKQFKDLSQAQRDRFADYGVTAENYGNAAEFLKGTEEIQVMQDKVARGDMSGAMGQSLLGGLNVLGMDYMGGFENLGGILKKTGSAEARAAAGKRVRGLGRDLMGSVGTGEGARFGAQLRGRGVGTSMSDMARMLSGEDFEGAMEGAGDIIGGVASMGRREQVGAVKALSGMGAVGQSLVGGLRAQQSMGRIRKKTIEALGASTPIGSNRARELADELGIEAAGDQKLNKEDAAALTKAIVKEVFGGTLTKEGASAMYDTRTQYEAQFMDTMKSMKTGADAMNSFVSVVDRVIPNWKERVAIMDKDQDEVGRTLGASGSK